MEEKFCLNKSERDSACDFLQTVNQDLESMEDREQLRDMRKILKKLKC